MIDQDQNFISELNGHLYIRDRKATAM